MNGRDTRFRLYVHTAYEGYGWQGCDETLSAALDAWRSDTGVWSDLADPSLAPTADNPVGGLIRYALDGTPGLFLWRVHVRRRGDARRRDSRYVAVLFLPFDRIAGLRIDFGRLWDAPLLREPQPGDVSDLSIDLCDPAHPCATRSSRSAESAPAWLADRSEEIPDGDESAVLGPVSRWFQSSGTEFGNLLAMVYPARNGRGIRAELRYRVFPEVAAAEELRSRFPSPPTASAADPGFAERVRDASEGLARRAEEVPTFAALSAYARDFARDARPFLDSSAVRPAKPVPSTDPLRGDIRRRSPFGASGRSSALRSSSGSVRGTRAADPPDPRDAHRRRLVRWMFWTTVGLCVLVLLAALALLFFARRRDLRPFDRIPESKPVRWFHDRASPGRP